jgi:hypothetical protein
MGLAHALKATGILTGLTPDDLAALDSYLKQGCADRHHRLEADTPLVSEFWDNYHYLVNAKDKPLNHSGEPTRIAISMEHYRSMARNEGLGELDMVLLKKELKKSKRHPFIEYSTVWSSAQKKAIKCFIFTNTEPDAVYQAKARAA